MLYTIFTTIVFIAEIIIAITIFQNLRRLDIAINNTNEIIKETKSGIKEVCILGREISYQMVEMSENFVEKVKRESEDSLAKYLSKILISIFFIKINSKIVKKFRKSKLKTMLTKALRVLEFVV